MYTALFIQVNKLFLQFKSWSYIYVPTRIQLIKTGYKWWAPISSSIKTRILKLQASFYYMVTLSTN